MARRKYEVHGQQPMLDEKNRSLFMSPREIASTMDLGDVEYGGDPVAVLRRKRSEATLYGLDKSIAAEGVKNPIGITHSPAWQKPEVTNGHHRLAVALDLIPDGLVPVKHYEHASGYGGPPGDTGPGTWGYQRLKMGADAVMLRMARERTQQAKQASKRKQMGL